MTTIILRPVSAQVAALQYLRYQARRTISLGRLREILFREDSVIDPDDVELLMEVIEIGL
jgi:hypothetical protein